MRVCEGLAVYRLVDRALMIPARYTYAGVIEVLPVNSLCMRSLSRRTEDSPIYRLGSSAAFSTSLLEM